MEKRWGQKGVVPACTGLAVQWGTWTGRSDGTNDIISHCGDGSYRREGQEQALCRNDIQPPTPPRGSEDEKQLGFEGAKGQESQK